MPATSFSSSSANWCCSSGHRAHPPRRLRRGSCRTRRARARRWRRVLLLLRLAHRRHRRQLLQLLQLLSAARRRRAQLGRLQDRRGHAPLVHRRLDRARGRTRAHRGGPGWNARGCRGCGRAASERGGRTHGTLDGRALQGQGLGCTRRGVGADRPAKRGLGRR